MGSLAGGRAGAMPGGAAGAVAAPSTQQQQQQQQPRPRAAAAPARAAAAAPRPPARAPVPDGATLLGADEAACPGVWRYDAVRGAKRLYPSQGVLDAWSAPPARLVSCQVLAMLTAGPPMQMPAGADATAGSSGSGTAFAAAPLQRSALAPAAAAIPRAAALPIITAPAVVRTGGVGVGGAATTITAGTRLVPRGDGTYAVVPPAG